MNFLFEGCNIVVMGVVNKCSIVWGIVCLLYEVGVCFIFIYVGECLEKLVYDFVVILERNDFFIFLCDVINDVEIEICFVSIKEQVGVIYGIVYCIVFVNKEEFVGEYLNMNCEGFLFVYNISFYFLIVVVKVVCLIMIEGGSIVIFIYFGGECVVLNYNVMGVVKVFFDVSVRYLVVDLGKENICVNSILVGLICMLFVKGISDFNFILKEIEECVLLCCMIMFEEVGDMAVFLFSDFLRGIMGENFYVDFGFYIIVC